MINCCENCPCYWQDHDETHPSCHYEDSNLYPYVPAPCDQDDYQEEEPDRERILAENGILPDEVNEPDPLFLDRYDLETIAEALGFLVERREEDLAGGWIDEDDRGYYLDLIERADLLAGAVQKIIKEGGNIFLT